MDVQIISVALLLTLSCFLLPGADSACFARHGCEDPSTNITYEHGQSWNNEDCQRCMCWSSKTLVKTCFVVHETSHQDQLPGFSDAKKSGQVSVALEEQQGPDEIILHADARTIDCPPLPEEFYDPNVDFADLPSIRQVNYIREFKGMACCTRYFYPINVDPRCESVWHEDECRYTVVMTDSTEPCTYPHGLVGK